MTRYHRPKLSRRAVLKGVGAAVALPWLESFRGRTFAAEPAAGPGGPGFDSPPRRYISMMFANGVTPKHWGAQGDGAQMKLAKSLAPLEKLKGEILVLNGLHVLDRNPGVHWPYWSNFFSGAEVAKGSIPECGQTCDQAMAQALGDRTAVPNLVLGIEPTHAGLRNGLPDIMWGTLSWRDHKTPVPPEIFPRQAFDKLFDRSGLARDRSVLDTVLGQSKSLRGELSASDQKKLDQYMQSVHEVEQRIARAQAGRPADQWQPTLAEPNLERPESGVPERTDEHMKLMLDIMILGLQTDRTRIATMLFNRDAGTMKFDFLEGVEPRPMHGGLSHHQNIPEVEAQYQRVNQYHVELLAYVMERLQGIEEGQTSILDNSMIVFGSSMIDGNRHDGDSAPLILAGRGGGTIRTGRTITYDKLEDRRLCNLHLALMQRMGMKVDKFGNSHYPLPNLG